MPCEIVLVDDDPEFAASMADVLEHEGHCVHVFETPEAAFEWLLSAERASLVLLDLRTPGMSTVRFRALLASSRALRDLAVVVVSGAPEAQQVASAVGAADVFEKPIDVNRLLRTVARHCREAEDRRSEAEHRAGH
jgi:two-component system nitrogen regulation response regulator NtrX